jgi:phage terminase small subunit
MPKITEKQKRFADEFLIDLNGKQAAIRAGYSEKTAEVQASRLLSNAKVQAYIQEQRVKLADKLDLSKERVLLEYSRIGFVDIRKLFNENGSMRKINELDDDTAAAVAAIEIEDLFMGFGEEREQIGFTKKIKLNGKKEALDSICKVLGYNAPIKRDITTKGESLNNAKEEKKPVVKLPDGTILEL